MALRNLPIGIQNFEKIRREGYLYVDKTALMHRLVTTGSYCFLSRPRRFGKSLLLSTIHAYFEGKRELFEGLAVAGLERKWEVHPVLHLDLNTQKYDTPGALEDILANALSEWEEQYGARGAERSLSLRFSGVIKRACERTGQSVVILVDEYDKPMLQAIGRPDLQEAYRDTLKAFYGALKSCDRYIRFAMLTGVTKFGKVSVFSDLNNLQDVSMYKAYNELCGLTERELQDGLGDYVAAMAGERGMTAAGVVDEMRRMYDGYHFAPGTAGVYNPFSVLNAFAAGAFGSYWFETGTPTYLVDLLRQHDYNLERMMQEETTEDVLNSVDVASTDPIPVIYQSGYLTIKGFDERFRTYRLGFPNAEVEEGFYRFLLPFYTSVTQREAPSYIRQLVQEIESGRVEDFLNRLRSFFADTPYELVRDLENHYQNVLFILFRLVGMYVRAEYHTSHGRIDLVMQTRSHTYVMEFKLDGTAEEALRQIQAKEYALPFATGGTQVVRVGVNFSSATRNIERWVIA